MGLIIRITYVLLFLAIINEATMARRELKSVSLVLPPPPPSSTATPSCIVVHSTLSACVQLGNLVTIGVNSRNDSCCNALSGLEQFVASIGINVACQCTRSFLGGLSAAILRPLNLDIQISTCGVPEFNFKLASNASCPTTNTPEPSIPPSTSVPTPSNPTPTPSTPVPTPSNRIPPILTPNNPIPTPSTPAPTPRTLAPTPLAAPNCSMVNTTLSACVVLGNLVTIGVNPTNDRCCVALKSLVNIQANIGAGVTCRCTKSFLAGLFIALFGPVNLNSKIKTCGVTGLDVELASNATCPSTNTPTIPTPPALPPPLTPPPTPLVALNCSTVNITLSACVRLGNLVTIGPNTQTDQCCNALGKLVNVQAGLGVGGTCRCTKNFLNGLPGANLGGILNLNTQVLLCGIHNLNFDLATNAVCPA